MGTIRKTITVTDQQGDWIKSQIESGHYTNDSEYIRDLIRRDQEGARLLRATIQEGLDSGVSKRSLHEIWDEAEKQHKAKYE